MRIKLNWTNVSWEKNFSPFTVKFSTTEWICCVKDDTLECLCKPSNDLSHPTLFTQPNKLKLMVKTRSLLQICSRGETFLVASSLSQCDIWSEIVARRHSSEIHSVSTRLFTMLLSHIKLGEKRKQPQVNFPPLLFILRNWLEIESITRLPYQLRSLGRRSRVENYTENLIMLRRIL